MPGTHSKYSPSKLTRIINCVGSVLATADITDVSSSYADEGTLLHKVTEKTIPHNQHVSAALIQHYKLTEAHVDAVNDVMDFISSIKMAHDGPFAEFIESKVSLESYRELVDCPGLKDVAGTLDYCLSFPDDRILYVIDWKFGVIEVLPDSPQLKAYALGILGRGALADTGYVINSSRYDKIVLVIGQPRVLGGDPFKTETFAAEELFSWLHTTLIPAINNAEKGSTVLTPSEAACRWCLVKGTCAARREYAGTVAESVFAVHAKLPHRTEIEEICDLLTKADELISYLKDIRLHVIDQLNKGVLIPGWKMVTGRSNRAWKNEADMLDYTAALGYSKTDMSVSKIMSPTQVERKLGRINTQIQGFKNLIIKPPGKPTLVPETDKRQPIQADNAESVFNKYVTGV